MEDRLMTRETIHERKAEIREDYDRMAGLIEGPSADVAAARRRGDLPGLADGDHRARCFTRGCRRHLKCRQPSVIELQLHRR